MRRLFDRLDDFTRFCLDWGSDTFATGAAWPCGDSPLLILLVVLGAAVLWLAVWLSEALGWNQ